MSTGEKYDTSKSSTKHPEKMVEHHIKYKDSDEFINVIVENTTNIKAWIPVLIEMINKDIGIIEVYSPVPFNEDYTDLLIGKVDLSNYSIQINTTVQEFNEYLNFFAERTIEGDIISFWKSVEELEELIDEKAEMDE